MACGTATSMTVINTQSLVLLNMHFDSYDTLFTNIVYASSTVVRFFVLYSIWFQLFVCVLLFRYTRPVSNSRRMRHVSPYNWNSKAHNGVSVRLYTLNSHRSVKQCTYINDIELNVPMGLITRYKTKLWSFKKTIWTVIDL